MTKVLIIGGGGMVGQKLAHHLAANGLNGDTVLDVTLLDIGFPATGGAAANRRISGNLTDPAIIKQIADLRADVIFHLAAIVSGEAEIDFDKGWATNMSAVWNILGALRGEHDASGGNYIPKVVFTSSTWVWIAVFTG